MTGTLRITDLAELHHLDDKTLGTWQKQGTQIFDTRELVLKIFHSRKRPPEWVAVIDRITQGGDAGSHEALKKDKTAGEVRRLDLINSRLSGDSFAKEDCQQVMASLGSALTLGLTEMSATLPSQLEGLNAEGVSLLLEAAIYKLREQLADLESDLWQRVYQETPEMAAAAKPENKTVRISTKTKTT
jgi:phage terminase Nu1 subunit (DNA packaging protein)